MVKYFYLQLVMFFVFSTGLIYCQDEQLSEKQQQLSQIQSEISTLEDDLKQKSSQEKKSNSTLENYNKQNYLINKLISTLRKEEKEKQSQINKTSKQIKLIEEEINQLRSDYSKYLVAIYKKGQNSEIESLLDASSVQQAMYRAQYLKKFSDKRKNDLQDLRMNINLLESKKLELEKEKEEKSNLVAKKQTEEKALKQKLNERKKILTSIRKDKKVIQNSLDAKKEAHKQIESIIAGLIEETERKKKLDLKRQQILASGDGTIINEAELLDDESYSEYESVISGFSSFTDLRGKMMWPLNKGSIIKKFGENRNKSLNTVTINYGIDIKSSKDENVRCVADGIVSAINWLPGYGSVIILTHKDDYRTVYGHLSEIFVNEGDKVNAGTLIAKVGESLDGKVLHFEIWNSRINQDPEKWLARK